MIGLTHWIPDQLSENGCQIKSYKAIPLFFSMNAKEFKQYCKDNNLYYFPKCGRFHDTIQVGLRPTDPFNDRSIYSYYKFTFKHNDPDSPILKVVGYKETIEKGGSFWCPSKKTHDEHGLLYKK